MNGRPAVGAVAAAQTTNDSPSFFYLRCNTTDWSPSQASLLTPVNGGTALELTFDVTNPHTLGVGDDCVVTETSVLGGWGASHHDLQFVDSGLTAPGVARWVGGNPADPPAAPSTYFKIHYPGPGRYTARLSPVEKFLSVAKADATSPGDARWVGAGNLSAGSGGALYRTTFRDGATLARVDAASGAARWVRTLQAGFVFDPSCAMSDVVVARDQSGLFALRSDTGEPVWTTTFSGEIAGPYAYAFPQCDEGRDVVYVSWTAPDDRFAAVQRSTGKTLWTTTGGLNNRVVATTAGVVVVVSDGGSGQRAQGIDAQSGAVRWTLEGDASLFVQTDGVGGVYAVSSRLIRRLDPQTGAPSWSRETSSTSPLVTYAGGVVFLEEGLAVSKLDRASGAATWTYTADKTQTPSVLVLPSGDVAVYGPAPATGNLVTSLVRGADGTIAWAKDFGVSSAWPVLDPSGRLYVRGALSLSLVDAATGATAWTYAYPAEQVGHLQGGLGGVVGSDEGAVFVTGVGPGYRYPAMSLLVLDVGTGALRYRHDESGAISLVASEGGRLYLETGYFNDEGIALVK